MNEQYAALITQLPLFAGYTLHGAQFVLDTGEIAEFQQGEVLCREGDQANFAVLVLSGKVQVYIERDGRTLALKEAGPGSVLGELGLLCGIPRAASMRASEKLIVLRWSSENFRRMMMRNSALSERIMRQSLQTLIDSEKALLDTVVRKQS